MDSGIMLIVAAGVGYVWGAACVKWGSSGSLSDENY